MWSIEKSLVPTDCSKPSGAAVEAAIELAKKFEASIVLLHAYQMPVYPYPVASAIISPVDLMTHVEHGAADALREIVSSQTVDELTDRWLL